MECPICLSPFDDPRVLPCGHTYCLKCLQQLGQLSSDRDSSSIDCPKCLRNFPDIHRTNVASLPRNYAVLELLKEVCQKHADGQTQPMVHEPGIMDSDNNLAIQAEELEVLRSIYGSQMTFEDEQSPNFDFVVTSERHDISNLRVHVTLPRAYPRNSAPKFSILSFEFSPAQRAQMLSALDHIYCENKGEPCLHDCIAKLYEFINDGLPVSSEDAVASAEVDYDNGNGCDGDAAMYTVLEDEFDCRSNSCGTLLASECKNAQVTGDNNCLPEIYSGEIVRDRKSRFQAYLCSVTDRRHVSLVLEHFKTDRKTADATHQIYAYQIKNGNISLHDCGDDGEHGAGSGLLHLLQVCGVQNVLVVVCRWYGGIHLGPDRFKHINGTAKRLLDQHGYITRAQGPAKKAAAKKK